MQVETPVCIIGGGPAGLAASLMLSKQGIHHILLERNQNPVEKVCGECYDGRLIHTFNKIDPTLIPQMLQEEVLLPLEHYDYTTNNGRVLQVNASINTSIPRVSTYRPHFDAWLKQKCLQNTFLEYRTGENVREINLNQQQEVIITTQNTFSVKAKIAIVCTGYPSLLVNKIVEPFVVKRNTPFLLAVRQYYTRLDDFVKGKNLVVRIIHKPVPAYLYAARLPGDKFTVELFVTEKTVKKHQRSPEEIFKRVLENYPDIAVAFAKATLISGPKWAVLPLSSTAKHPLFSKGILMAGSCGSHVNPLTGWGVGHAVFEAYHAAITAANCVQQNNFKEEQLKLYQKTVLNKLAEDFKKGRMVDFCMQYLHYPLNSFLNLAASNKWMSKKIAKTLTGV
jgi:menaquinone-9 beta-reductase